MATKQTEPTRIPFPLGGLNKDAPFYEQPEGTTRIATNVRPRSSLTGALSGGSRPGLSKDSDEQISASGPVQHIASAVTVIDTAIYEQNRVAIAAEPAAEDDSVNLLYGDGDGGNTSGNEINITTATVPGGEYKAMVYDSDANLYIHIAGSIYKYGPDLSYTGLSWYTGQTDDAVSIGYMPEIGYLFVQVKFSNSSWGGAAGRSATAWLIDPETMTQKYHATQAVADRGHVTAARVNAACYDPLSDAVILVTGYSSTSGSVRSMSIPPTEDSPMTLNWEKDASDIDSDEGGTEGVNNIIIDGSAVVIDGFVYVPCVDDNLGQHDDIYIYKLDASDGSHSDYWQVGTPAVSPSTLHANDFSGIVKSSDDMIIVAVKRYEQDVGWVEKWNPADKSRQWTLVKNTDGVSDFSSSCILLSDGDGGCYLCDQSVYVSGEWKQGAVTGYKRAVHIDSSGLIAWSWDADGPNDTLVDSASLSTSNSTTGMAVFIANFDEQPTRERVSVVVADGSIKSYPGNSDYTGGSSALTDSLNKIQSAWHSQNLYFVDGDSAKTLVLLRSTSSPWDTTYQQVVNWTSLVSSDGDGTLPAKARLIARYRNRMVLAGQVSEPQNWHMSAVGDPLDWNTSPTTLSALMAVSGTNSDAGEVGDVVTALIPWSDDTLIFGGDKSVYVMSGDPADGGTLDLISDQVGVSFGKAWTRDPLGNTYFFGSDANVYRMGQTGSGMDSITAKRMEREFESIDMTAYCAMMEWDVIRQGFYLYFVPFAYNTYNAITYFWSQETDSWWKDEYPASCGPAFVSQYASESVSNSRVLFGGMDGYVRKVDESVATDDGTSVESEVALMAANAGPGKGVMLSGAKIVTDADGGDVSFKVYSGTTAEECWEASSSKVDVSIPGGVSKTINHRVRGNALRLSLEASGVRWGFEASEAFFVPAGMARRV